MRGILSRIKNWWSMVVQRDYEVIVLCRILKNEEERDTKVKEMRLKADMCFVKIFTIYIIVYVVLPRNISRFAGLLFCNSLSVYLIIRSS